MSPGMVWVWVIEVVATQGGGVVGLHESDGTGALMCELYVVCVV